MSRRTSKPLLSLMTSILAASVLSVSSAATTASSQTASTTTSATGTATHTIQVGANGFSFSPNNLTADPGDTLKFEFFPSNHSVVQAAYGYACIPYSYVAGNPDGFWSGFYPLSSVSEDPPSYSVTVNDTDPIFFYCSAPGACNEDGMVGVVNPTANETYAAQLADAKEYTFSLSPGDAFPAEESNPTTSSTSSSTATATSSSTATTSAASSGGGGGGGGLSGGAIAGIAIGGAAVAILAAALLYMCGRQKTFTEILGHRNRPMSESHAGSYMPGPLSPTSESHYSGVNRNSDMTYAHGYDPENESYRSRSPPVDEGYLNPQRFAPAEMANHPNGQRPVVPDGSNLWLQKGEIAKPQSPPMPPAELPASPTQYKPPKYD